ncbi:MAG: cytochrome c [Thermoanaerobaculia bacterium]
MSPGKNRGARRVSLMVAMLVAGLTLAACRPQQQMADQPAYQPLEASDFYADGMSARKPVDGTIARGHLRDDTLLYTGRTAGAPSALYPFEITRADLERGRERFEIFCSPCHGQTGQGDGMIVRRGYRRPPSYHTDRLRELPAGHFYDVMTNGFGVMPSYAAQIPVRDRWLIAAYIRVLQLSQSAPAEAVPAEERAKLVIPGGAQ